MHLPDYLKDVNNPENYEEYSDKNESENKSGNANVDSNLIGITSMDYFKTFRIFIWELKYF